MSCDLKQREITLLKTVHDQLAEMEHIFAEREMLLCPERSEGCDAETQISPEFYEGYNEEITLTRRRKRPRVHGGD